MSSPESPVDHKAAGDRLVEAMKSAELRGMGGAGFPTFRRWADVRDAKGDQKYIVCNADESEPARSRIASCCCERPT